LTFVEYDLYLMYNKLKIEKMENQTYKLKDTFTITNECANQEISKIVITDVKTTCYEPKYKLTFHFVSELNDGSFKKSRRSTWYNEQSINIMINDFRSIVKSN
jgi:hypothetical protein